MGEISLQAAQPVTINADGWDSALREHGGHLLQSWKWGEFKSRFGWQPERIHIQTPAGQAFAQVLYRSRGPISVGYCPRGPLMIGDKAALWPELRKEIDRISRRRRAMNVIIEPDEPMFGGDDLAGTGLKPGPEHNQPGRTVMVPLAEDDVMLKQMHQKTRYSVRLAMRRGVEVVVKDPHDQAALGEFYRLLADTAERNEFEVHSREYYEEFMDVFREDAFFVFASFEGNLCAVVIAASFGAKGTYMYGASSTEHRGHGAAFLLQFEAMKWSRDRGCTHYDLWGIPKVDPDSVTSEDKSSIAGTKGDDWRGIFRFKTGFGGDILTFPETAERQYIPGLPWLARKLGVIAE